MFEVSIILIQFIRQRFFFHIVFSFRVEACWWNYISSLPFLPKLTLHELLLLPCLSKNGWNGKYATYLIQNCSGVEGAPAGQTFVSHEKECCGKKPKLYFRLFFFLKRQLTLLMGLFRNFLGRQIEQDTRRDEKYVRKLVCSKLFCSNSPSTKYPTCKVYQSIENFRELRDEMNLS